MSLTRSIRALALSVTLLCAAAATPEPVAAQQENVCHDKAWADYNECLMTSPTEWEKRDCDSEFYGDYLLCYFLPYLIRFISRAL